MAVTRFCKRMGAALGVAVVSLSAAGLAWWFGTAPGRPEPVIGEQIKDCEPCPELVVVPPGSYLRGSPSNEAERQTDEGPQRLVTIPAAFAVGKYEVTFDQWDACVAAGACSHSPSDEGWGRGRRPVISISWYDAQQYVDWLTKLTGKRYRLLTEAEWEYLVRAGTQTEFSTGASISSDHANYNGDAVYGSGAKGMYRGQTVPVDDLPLSRNAWGLAHMHGNAMEWVQDCYHDSYEAVPVDGSASEDSACKLRSLRGGSWSCKPRNLRSANRSSFTMLDRDSRVGLRVARGLR